MAWDPTLYSLVGLGAAGITAVVGAKTWQHRDERGARQFLWLLLALGGWSLVSAIQLGFSTEAEQLVWQRVALSIGGMVPTLWLLFALRYTGHNDLLSRAIRALLAVEPAAFAVLTLTNPTHGLVWTGSSLATTQAGPAVVVALGVGYYVHAAYAYAVIAAGFGLLTFVAERSSAVYRRQTGFLILGVLPPLAVNVAFTFDLSWGPLPAIDPTPFAFAVTGVLWALALFQFDLLNRTPIARRRVLEEMGDGLIICDTDGRIVNANDVARAAVDPTPEAGRSVATLASGLAGADGAGAGATDSAAHDPASADDPATADGPPTADGALSALDGRTVRAAVGGRRRAYDTEVSSLTDYHGGLVGHAVALRDVTERNEYEQRLEVAQRVLRHNLRNEMSVIRGWAEQVAETSGDGVASAAQRIIDTTDELIDLSEKTNTIAQLGSPGPDDRTAVDAGAVIVDVVEEFRGQSRKVTVECDLPDAAAVALPGPEFLEIPVSNLVENAIEHNDADDPLVRVCVEAAGERIRVGVEDNGPPIPSMEREVLEAGAEGPLEHGSGVGLWLTYWSVETVGGSVDFDDRDPRGNVVTLDLPRAGRSLRRSSFHASASP